MCGHGHECVKPINSMALFDISRKLSIMHVSCSQASMHAKLIDEYESSIRVMDDDNP